jgi:putative inorganic carbon (HCO3(-)) transporter
VILLPLALGMLLFTWRKQTRLEQAGLLLAATGMLVVLVLTKSRGAWMGLAAALAVLVVLRWRWGWLALVAGVAGVSAWIASLGWGPFLELLTANEAIRGLDGRIEIWSRGLYLVRDFPLTGAGMGAYGPLVDRLYPFFLEPPGSIPHAHNLFLQVAVDLGLPGLLAWLVVVVGVLVGAWRVWQAGRRRSDALALRLGAGLLACLAAMAVHGITDAVVWTMVRSAPLVWAVFGMICAAHQVYYQETPLPESR